jgi:hypothetical protein
MGMVLVFKTTVKYKKDIQKLRLPLNEILGKGNWSFDLEDCDKVLRAKAEGNISSEIATLLYEAGFGCEEME